MKVNDKVFIVQEGTLYGRGFRNCATILAGTIDFVTTNEVTIKVVTEENETLLLVVQPTSILSTPQQALEAIQAKVFNIKPVIIDFDEAESKLITKEEPNH